jgi:hypothetical protein
MGTTPSEILQTDDFIGTTPSEILQTDARV